MGERLGEVNSSEQRRTRRTFLLMWRRSSAHLRQPVVPGIGALMFFNIFSKVECSFQDIPELSDLR